MLKWNYGGTVLLIAALFYNNTICKPMHGDIFFIISSKNCSTIYDNYS